jgi:hypothetical protein
MATAARRLQWLLLFISFSAVLRPTWTGLLDQTDYEGLRTGFWQPDGAGRASSVRGLHFPVWCLLVHFGSINKRASRSAIRRMRLAGVHQPARHLLLSHGMSTTHTPLGILFEKFCDQTSTAELRVFLGVGSYFLLLLLACQDVERHPGPFPLMQQYKLSHMIDKSLSKTPMFSTSPLKTEIKSDDVNPLIIELVINGCELASKNFDLRERLFEMEKRVSYLEKEQRRKNIVVFGVPTEKDLENVVDDVVLKQLSSKKRSKEEIIERAYRFGRETPQRPILIRFKNESDKARAMKMAPNLRGSKITISNDLTTEERETRRKIVDAHKAARAENIESKVLRQGLLVNGELMPVTELCKSDWLEKFMQKVDDIPLAIANECSPPVTPALSQNDDSWLYAPRKKNKKFSKR